MSSISASGASSLSQAQLAQEVGMRVAAKTLDAARAQGDAAISLLQAAAEIQQQTVPSADPHMGTQLDVKA